MKAWTVLTTKLLTNMADVTLKCMCVVGALKKFGLRKYHMLSIAKHGNVKEHTLLGFKT